MKSFKQQLDEGLLYERGKRDGPEYRRFFSSALKKFGVKSQDELSGKKQKDFFAYVDDNWKSDSEERRMESSSPEDEKFNDKERERALKGDKTPVETPLKKEKYKKKK